MQVREAFAFGSNRVPVFALSKGRDVLEFDQKASVLYFRDASSSETHCSCFI